LLYIGAGGVVSGALLILRLVALSEVSSLGKVAIWVLCISAMAFALLGVATRQAQRASVRRAYWRAALIAWCVGAVALVVLAVAARLALL
jgi:hypothetical protein